MPYRRPVNIFLSGFIVIGICALFVIAMISISHTDSGRDAARAAEQNTRIAQQNTARTECIRAISNELDHARWSLVWQAFAAQSREVTNEIGNVGRHLPQPIDVANDGGDILNKHFARCPAAPTEANTTKG